MKYEYLKGSEKDFEGAPDSCMQAIRSNADGSIGFCFELDYMCAYHDKLSPVDGDIIMNPAMFKVIAERRPITEPSWDGVGLPPVGCECEASINWGESWDLWYTMAEDSGVVIFGYLDGNHVAYGKRDMPIFRPLRSEADKKRDAVIEFITGAIDSHGVDPLNSAKFIYDAIAAADKIPGVKLED